MEYVLIWVVLQWLIMLALAVGTIVAVVIIINNYQANTRIRKAEWLRSLLRGTLVASNGSES